MISLGAGLGLAGLSSFAEERPDTQATRVAVPELSAGRARATIALEQWGSDHSLNTRDIEVTDLEGRDLSSQTQQRVAGERLQLSLPAQAQFIIRPRDVVAMRLPEQRTVLPGGVVRTAGPGGQNEQVDAWFRPTIMASPLPVTWSAELRRYSTRVFLGLRLPDDAAGSELERPITMRLAFRGMTADPVDDVRLTAAGLEHEQRVDLQFLPTTESPVLELRSPLGDADLAMDVLPRLELRPVGSNMPGFGLGTMAVDVLHLHPHGAPAAVAEDTLVTLEIDGGARPEPDRVVIRRGESSERFLLRSASLGPATIKATAGGLTDQRTVGQRPPIGPLIAALLGGALGGYSRRFQKSAPDASSAARLAEGTAVALVAYAASVLGVGWLQLPIAIAATEAGAFLTGVVAGFAGVAVIETLTRRLRPAPDSAE